VIGRLAGGVDAATSSRGTITRLPTHGLRDALHLTLFAFSADNQVVVRVV
jgi:hypothetical protein